MKLMRYGAKGAEKPALVDAQGQVRDLSRELADITAATPLLMAARKGTSSTESSRAQGASMTGSEMWVSVPVSP